MRWFFRTASALGLLSLSLIVQAAAPAFTQPQLNAFAQAAELRFGVISNFDSSGDQLKAHLILTNHSSVALPAGEGSWRMYFHGIRRIAAADMGGLHLRHINGDLQELAPTASFKGLAVGEKLEFIFNSSEWMVSYSDFMPRAFIAQTGLTPAVFANTDTENLASFVEPFSAPNQQLRYGTQAKDLYPIATPQSRYQANLALEKLAVDPQTVALHIIPTPKSMTLGKGKVQLDSRWQIRYAGRLAQEALYLQQALKEVGVSVEAKSDDVPATGPVIQLVATLSGAPETYQLNLDSSKITINGSDNAGSFYSAVSLLNLLPAEKAIRYDLPTLSLTDSPRFAWRGMHYDMGRNFHGKAVTLRLIDQMARYKLNKLHMHLSEDEGWRLEIAGLPELTEIGGARCFDLTEQTCLLTQLGTGPHKTGTGNGFFTQADFIEILQYAAVRHIEVIPEIDMPGHSRAAIKSMQVRYNRYMKAGNKAAAEAYLLSDPQDSSQYSTAQNYTDNSINLCLPSTYAFADKVIYEIQQLYRKAGVTLNTFHMGGDEVGAGSWEKSPACHALFAKGEKAVAGVADLKPYFVGKIAEITSRRGLGLAGWEDGLMYDPLNTFNRKQFNNERVIANPWDNIWEWGRGDRAYRLANAGYQVVLSPGTHLYFDHPHEANAEERGYYWATRYSDVAKVFGFMPDNYYANADKTRDGAPIENLEALVGRELPRLTKPENIIGMQGQVWSETIRTPQQLEQMVYPRLIALAERAWSKAAWESNKPDVAARDQDWALFAHALVQKELPKLAAKGISFYLPPAGASQEKGKIQINTGFPGLPVEYSLDNGASWQVFCKTCVLEQKSVLLRTTLGGVYSRTEKIN